MDCGGEEEGEVFFRKVVVRKVSTGYVVEDHKKKSDLFVANFLSYTCFGLTAKGARKEDSTRPPAEMKASKSRFGKERSSAEVLQSLWRISKGADERFPCLSHTRFPLLKIR